ncbi:hypothetical protein [Methanobrevibacter cuticularis]|uniref:hypothetical protein n=1 Tax=Methanobrevibacter cuticularis TaxID=47311 RepID=UPI0014720D50|nr:hypothetical protein [Methanobrevibacter cuticularis]
MIGIPASGKSIIHVAAYEVFDIMDEDKNKILKIRPNRRILLFEDILIPPFILNNIVNYFNMNT